MTKEEKNQTSEEKIQTSEEKKYFAFISYSHKDKAAAKKLHDFMEGYKLPANLNGKEDLPKRIRPIFRDEAELKGGELTPQIQEALRNSRYLIVVCSPRSAQSYYVNEEIKYFQSLGRETKILPYIIDGKPTTDEDPDCCYTTCFKELQKKYELLGGDVRDLGDKAAALKIMAPMLGVEFASLHNRFAQQERKKRNIIIAVSAAFVLLMACVTAWILFLYKDVQESKSVILGENAMNKIEKGDYLGARRTALEAITLSYSPEAEVALRQSWESNSGILEGHYEIVYSVSWSPDGKYLASSSADKTIIIWDAKSGVCIRTLEGHSGEVESVSWSPDGKYLASGSGDKTVKIWDAKSGECIRTLKGHSLWVESVCWSPDGNYLASGSWDKTVKIWDAKSGECIRTLKGHSDFVESVCWSPDGNYLASGSWDKTVKIWDAKSGACLQTLKGHSMFVYSVRWSPDGKYLASGSGDKTVKIWDAKSGACLQTLEGHEKNVPSVYWSPDGKYLVSGSSDKTLIIWNVNSGQKIKTLEGHSRSVNSVSWSPDGKYLASGSGDKTVKIWDLSEVKKYSVLDSIPVNTYSSNVSPNGRYEVARSSEREYVIVYKNSNKIFKNKYILYKRLEGTFKKSYKYSWSPNGKYLIGDSFDGKFGIWNAENGLYIQTFEYDNASVRFVGFTSDGRKIISKGNKGKILQWDFPPLDELIEKTKKWAGK